MNKEKFEILFLSLVFGGFAFLSFIFSGLKLSSSLFTGIYHSAVLIVSIYLILTNFNRRISFLFLIFWFLYIFRIVYDIGIANIYLSNRLTPLGYIFYAVGVTFVPALAASQVSVKSIIKSRNIIFLLLFISIAWGGINNFNISNFLSFNSTRFQANDFLQTIYYGHYSVSLILLAISILFSKNKKYSFICYVSIILATFSIGLAGSRSPVFSLFICLILFFTLRKSNLFLKILSFSMFIVFVIYQGANLVETSKSYGFETLVNRTEKTLDDGDLSARNILIKDGLEMFYSNPVLGDAFLLQEGLGKGYYPHNFFIDTLISGGVVLTILFIMLLRKGVLLSLRIIRSSNLTWLGLLFIQYLALGMASGALWSSKIFWVIFGLIIGMNKSKINE